MGSLISSHLSETFKKNQENMQATQKKNMETQMALGIARSREMFNWISTFYGVAAFGLLNGFRKTKKPVMIVPLVPLTFVTAFYWDLAYGTKIQRIRQEAENILGNERDILQLPKNEPLTDQSVRSAVERLQRSRGTTDGSAWSEFRAELSESL